MSVRVKKSLIPSNISVHKYPTTASILKDTLIGALPDQQTFLISPVPVEHFYFDAKFDAPPTIFVTVPNPYPLANIWGSPY